MIFFNGVTKKYINKDNSITYALKDISFKLPNKGLIGIIGKNGSGKTTLLNLLSSYDVDYEGTILIDDLNIKSNYEYIRNRMVSYVFQKNIFINDLNVIENILYVNNKADTNQEIIHSVGIKYPHELSGGQKQIISLMRGIKKNSRILIVDEPTNNLDEKMTNKIINILKEISKEKLVIFVSHDLDLINAYCNTIIKLNDGRLEYIKENKTISDVLYEDDSITFFGDINLYAINQAKMNEVLRKNKEITIKKKNPIQLSYSENDYTIDKHSYLVNKFESQQKKLLFKSYLHNSIFKFLLYNSIFILLFLALNIFANFTKFNSNEFLYNLISSNQDTYIICEKKNSYLSNDLKKEDLNDFSKEYDLNIDFSYNPYENINFDFESADLNYSLLGNIVVTNFKNYVFTYGSAPVDLSKVAITDFIADGFIKGNEYYNNYEDIIKNGIYFDEQKINISGIIDTNYEKYSYRINDGLDLTYKDFVDFNYYRKNFYNAIFYSDNSNNIKKISGVHIGAYTKIFTDIIVDDELFYYGKVNKTLAEKLNYTGEFPAAINTDFGSFDINGIVEDGSDQCKIFISKTLSENVKPYKSYFDTFMFNFDNKNIFDFLKSYNVSYLCYSRMEADKIIYVVDSLQKIFNYLFSFVIIGICFLFFIYHFDKTNKNLYWLFKTNGNKEKEFVKVECFINGIYVLFSFLINCILYYLFYFILNSHLKKSFNINMKLFINDFLMLSILFASAFIIFCVIYMIKVFVRKRCNLIKFIK